MMTNNSKKSQKAVKSVEEAKELLKNIDKNELLRNAKQSKLRRGY